MFISPYFGGCKYTNNFLFINKKAEFQQFDLLITSATQSNSLYPKWPKLARAAKDCRRIRPELRQQRLDDSGELIVFEEEAVVAEL